MTLERGLTGATSERELLSLLSEAITSDLDLQRVLQTVTDVGTEVSGAEFGAFFYNDRDETGRVYQLHVLSGAFLDTFRAMPKPRITQLFEPTFSGVDTVLIDDVRSDPRFSGMPPGHLPVRSYLAVPVVSRSGDVIGALLFGHREIGVFDEGCLRLLVTVAAQAAVAVENARLFAAEQRARRKAEDATARLVVLQSLATRLSTALTVDEAVQAMVEIIMGPTGATRVGLFLRQGETHRHHVPHTVDADTAPLLTELPDGLPNPVRDAIDSGQQCVVLDRDTVRERYPELTVHVDHLPAVTVVLPLTVAHDALGALTFAWDDERTLDDADVDMLRAAAAQVSNAVDRARLFEAERAARAELATSIKAATETSRVLQRSLLPRTVPDIDGMTIAVRYQASDVDAEVGGDWYDVVPRGRGAVLVIGDVQGHNLAAAALMGQLRTGLHAYLAEGHPIEHAVARANHLMAQLTGDALATCCLVEIDPVAQELRTVCAGHPSPICLTTDNDMVRLPEEPGLPLGAVPDSTWRVTRAPLSSSTRVVLYTDGLIERRGHDIYDGLAALRQQVVGLDSLGAEEAAGVLVRRMGGNAEDDLAVVVCDVFADDVQRETRTIVFDAGTASIGEVRRQARDVLTAWNRSDLEFTAALLVSELVTNVFRHTDGAGALQLQPLHDGVRIAVTDTEDRLPALDLEPGDEATNGRGLWLMKAFSDRWGVQLNPRGKTIWAELRATQANLVPGAEVRAAV